MEEGFDRYGLVAAFSFKVQGNSQTAMNDVMKSLAGIEQKVKSLADSLKTSGVGSAFSSVAQQIKSAVGNITSSLSVLDNGVKASVKSLVPLTEEFRALKAEGKSIGFGSELKDVQAFSKGTQEIRDYIAALKTLETQIAGNTAAEREFLASLKNQQAIAPGQGGVAQEVLRPPKGQTANKALNPLRDEFRALKAESQNISFGIDPQDHQSFAKGEQDIRNYIEALKILESQVQGNTAAEREFLASLKSQQVAAANRVDVAAAMRSSPRQSQNTIKDLNPLRDQFKALKAESKNINFGSDFKDTGAFTKAEQDVRHYITALKALEGQVSGNTAAEREFVASLKTQQKALRNRTDIAAATRDSAKASERIGIAQGVKSVGDNVLGMVRNPLQTAQKLQGQVANIKKLADDVSAQGLIEVQNAMFSLSAKTATSATDVGAVFEDLASSVSFSDSALPQRMAEAEQILKNAAALRVSTDKATQLSITLGSVYRESLSQKLPGFGSNAELSSRVGSSVNELADHLENVKIAASDIIPVMNVVIATLGDKQNFRVDQIAAYAAAISSLKVIDKKAAASFFSRTSAVMADKKHTGDFAETLGFDSTEEFGQALDTNKFGLIIKLIEKYKNLEGGELVKGGFLKKLGIGSVQDQRVIQGLASNLTVLTDAEKLALKGFQENASIDTAFGKRFDTAAFQGDRLAKSFDSLKSKLGMSLQEALLPAVTKLADLTEGLIRLAEKHPQVAKAIAIGVAAFGALAVAAGTAGIALFSFQQAAAGIKLAGVALSQGLTPITSQISMGAFSGKNPLLGFFGILKSQAGAIAAPLAGASTGVGGFGAAVMGFLSSPLTLGILGVTGLLIAVEKLAPQLGILGSVLGGLGAPFAFVFGLAKGFFGTIISSIAKLAGGSAGAIAEPFALFGNALKKAMTILGSVAGSGEAVGSAIANGIIAPIHILSRLLSPLASVASGIFSSVGAGLSFVTGGIGGVVSAFTSAGSLISGLWNATIGGIVGRFQGLIDAASWIGQKLVSLLAENSPGPTFQVREKWQSTLEFLSGLFGWIANAANFAGNAISSAISLAVGVVNQGLATLNLFSFQPLVDIAAQAGRLIGGIFEATIGKVGGAIASVRSLGASVASVFTQPQKAVQNLGSTIASAGGGLLASAGSAIQGAIAPVGATTEASIQAPSAGIFDALATGLEWITEKFQAFQAILAQPLTLGFAGAISGTIDWFSTSFPTSIQGFVTGLTTIASSVTETLEPAFVTIKAVIEAAFAPLSAGVNMAMSLGNTIKSFIPGTKAQPTPAAIAPVNLKPIVSPIQQSNIVSSGDAIASSVNAQTNATISQSRDVANASLSTINAIKTNASNALTATQNQLTTAYNFANVSSAIAPNLDASSQITASAEAPIVAEQSKLSSFFSNVMSRFDRITSNTLEASRSVVEKENLTSAIASQSTDKSTAIASSTQSLLAATLPPQPDISITFPNVKPITADALPVQTSLNSNLSSAVSFDNAVSSLAYSATVAGDRVNSFSSSSSSAIDGVNQLARQTINAENSIANNSLSAQNNLAATGAISQNLSTTAIAPITNLATQSQNFLSSIASTVGAMISRNSNQSSMGGDVLNSSSQALNASATALSNQALTQQPNSSSLASTVQSLSSSVANQNSSIGAIAGNTNQVSQQATIQNNSSIENFRNTLERTFAANDQTQNLSAQIDSSTLENSFANSIARNTSGIQNSISQENRSPSVVNSIAVPAESHRIVTPTGIDRTLQTIASSSLETSATDRTSTLTQMPGLLRATPSPAIPTTAIAPVIATAPTATVASPVALSVASPNLIGMGGNNLNQVSNQIANSTQDSSLSFNSAIESATSAIASFRANLINQFNSQFGQENNTTTSSKLDQNVDNLASSINANLGVTTANIGSAIASSQSQTSFPIFGDTALINTLATSQTSNNAAITESTTRAIAQLAQESSQNQATIANAISSSTLNAPAISTANTLSNIAQSAIASAMQAKTGFSPATNTTANNNTNLLQENSQVSGIMESATSAISSFQTQLINQFNNQSSQQNNEKIASKLSQNLVALSSSTVTNESPVLGNAGDAIASGQNQSSLVNSLTSSQASANTTLAQNTTNAIAQLSQQSAQSQANISNTVSTNRKEISQSLTALNNSAIASSQSQSGQTNLANVLTSSQASANTTLAQNTTNAIAQLSQQSIQSQANISSTIASSSNSLAAQTFNALSNSMAIAQTANTASTVAPVSSQIAEANGIDVASTIQNAGDAIASFRNKLITQFNNQLSDKTQPSSITNTNQIASSANLINVNQTQATNNIATQSTPQATLATDSQNFFNSLVSTADSIASGTTSAINNALTQVSTSVSSANVGVQDFNIDGAVSSIQDLVNTAISSQANNIANAESLAVNTVKSLQSGIQNLTTGINSVVNTSKVSSAFSESNSNANSVLSNIATAMQANSSNAIASASTGISSVNNFIENKLAQLASYYNQATTTTNSLITQPSLAVDSTIAQAPEQSTVLASGNILEQTSNQFANATQASQEASLNFATAIQNATNAIASFSNQATAQFSGGNSSQVVQDFTAGIVNQAQSAIASTANFVSNLASSQSSNVTGLTQRTGGTTTIDSTVSNLSSNATGDRVSLSSQTLGASTSSPIDNTTQQTLTQSSNFSAALENTNSIIASTIQQASSAISSFSDTAMRNVSAQINNTNNPIASQLATTLTNLNSNAQTGIESAQSISPIDNTTQQTLTQSSNFSAALENTNSIIASTIQQASSAISSFSDTAMRNVSAQINNTNNPIASQLATTLTNLNSNAQTGIESAQSIANNIGNAIQSKTESLVSGGSAIVNNAITQAQQIGGNGKTVENATSAIASFRNQLITQFNNQFNKTNAQIDNLTSLRQDLTASSNSVIATQSQTVGDIASTKTVSTIPDALTSYQTSVNTNAATSSFVDSDVASSVLSANQDNLTNFGFTVQNAGVAISSFRNQLIAQFNSKFSKTSAQTDNLTSLRQDLTASSNSVIATQSQTVGDIANAIATSAQNKTDISTTNNASILANALTSSQASVNANAIKSAIDASIKVRDNSSFVASNVASPIASTSENNLTSFGSTIQNAGNAIASFRSRLIERFSPATGSTGDRLASPTNNATNQNLNAIASNNVAQNTGIESAITNAATAISTSASTQSGLVGNVNNLTIQSVASATQAENITQTAIEKPNIATSAIATVSQAFSGFFGGLFAKAEQATQKLKAPEYTPIVGEIQAPRFDVSSDVQKQYQQAKIDKASPQQLAVYEALLSVPDKLKSALPENAQKLQQGQFSGLQQLNPKLAIAQARSGITGEQLSAPMPLQSLQQLGAPDVQAMQVRATVQAKIDAINAAKQPSLSDRPDKFLVGAAQQAEQQLRTKLTVIENLKTQLAETTAAGNDTFAIRYQLAQVEQSLSQVQLSPQTQTFLHTLGFSPDGIAATTNQVLSNVQNFGNEFQDRMTFYKNGGNLAEAIAPGVEQMQVGFNQLGGNVSTFSQEAFNSLKVLNFEGVKNSAVTFSGAAATSIGAIGAGFNSASLSAIAFGVFSIASLSPIPLIIGGIAAGVAIAATNFLGLRTIIASLVQTFYGVLDAALSVGIGIVQAVRGIFTAVGGIVPALTGDFSQLGAGVGMIFEGIQTGAGGLARGLGNVLGGAVGVVQGIFEGLGQIVRVEVLQGIINSVANFAGNIKGQIEGLAEAITTAIKRPAEVWNNFFNRAKGGARQVQNNAIATPASVKAPIASMQSAIQSAPQVAAKQTTAMQQAIAMAPTQPDAIAPLEQPTKKPGLLGSLFARRQNLTDVVTDQVQTVAEQPITLQAPASDATEIAQQVNAKTQVIDSVKVNPTISQLPEQIGASQASPVVEAIASIQQPAKKAGFLSGLFRGSQASTEQGTQQALIQQTTTPQVPNQISTSSTQQTKTSLEQSTKKPGLFGGLFARKQKPVSVVTDQTQSIVEQQPIILQASAPDVAEIAQQVNTKAQAIEPVKVDIVIPQLPKQIALTQASPVIEAIAQQLPTQPEAIAPIQQPAKNPEILSELFRHGKQDAEQPAQQLQTIIQQTVAPQIPDQISADVTQQVKASVKSPAGETVLPTATALPAPSVARAIATPIATTPSPLPSPVARTVGAALDVATGKAPDMLTARATRDFDMRLAGQEPEAQLTAGDRVQLASQKIETLISAQKPIAPTISNTTNPVFNGASALPAIDATEKKLIELRTANQQAIASTQTTINAVGSVVGSVAPQIAAPVYAIGDLIQGVGNLREAVPNLGRSLVTVFPSLASVGTAASATFTSIAAGGAGLSASLTALGTSVSTVFAGMSATIAPVLLPVLPVLGAIAASTTVLYLAFKNNFLGITDLVTGIGSSIKGFFYNLFGGAYEIVTSVFATIDQEMRGIFQTISSVGQDLIRPFAPLFKLFIGESFNAGSAIIKGLLTPLQLAASTLSTLVKIVAGITKGLIVAGGAIASVLLFPLTLVSNAVVGTIGAIQGLGSAIASVGSSVLGFLFSPFQQVWNIIQAIGSGLANLPIIGKLFGGFNTIGGAIPQAPAVAANPSATAAPMQAFSKGGLVQSEVGLATRPQPTQAFATGGLVTGPGTSTGDRVIAAVSPGEFVVNAEATRQNYGLIEAINSGQFTAPPQAFSQGGLVQPQIGDRVISAINYSSASLANSFGLASSPEVGSSAIAVAPPRLPQMVDPPIALASNATGISASSLASDRPIEININFGDIVLNGNASSPEVADEFLDRISPQLERSLRDMLRNILEEGR